MIRTAGKTNADKHSTFKILRNNTLNMQDLELDARKLTSLVALQSMYTKFTNIFIRKICRAKGSSNAQLAKFNINQKQSIENSEKGPERPQTIQKMTADLIEM